MPALSSGDLALLRDERHRTFEYLAVLQPGTVLACRLNGTPSGDPITQVNYDGVTEGAYTDVVANMTLWVGTSAGGRQKGTCRIRKAPTSSILYVAEDSAIDWSDNDYLTVVENYELWIKYPRIIADGSPVFYKDWDVSYSDQHSNWAPVAVLGPPDCQFIEAGTGLATCKFVGDRSYPVAPGATLTGYSWSFPGGTPSTASTAGTEAAPHTVTWDTPGRYWISLTVTDSNGKTHTGRRPVFIFPETGEGAPYTQVKMPSRSGNINQHGHTASFEVHGDADQAQFPDRALVVYFTEDWYGNTKKSIGGNFPYRAHVRFVGYIQSETTVKDPQTSMVTFDAATIHALMDSREGFSSWIKTKGSASNWCEATNLTADRAALSLCRYNSTLLDITDVMISGDTLLIKSQEFAAKTSLLQQLQTLYDDLFAHVACDKQGRVYFEKDPQMRPVANRSSIPIIADLTHGDWRERINLPRPQEPKTSFINLGGVYYPGHPAEVVAILSKAPGDAPAYMGTTREINGLILSGQSDGNVKAGLALAYDNNEFPAISMPMAGDWDVFDIVPQEYVRLSLAADETKRGIVWTNQKLIPRQVTLTVEDTEQGRVHRVDIEVEKDSYGPAGVDGDYPNEVPDPAPPYTPPPYIPPPPGGEEGDGNLLYFVDGVSGHVFRTRNAQEVNPANVVYEDLGLINSKGLTWITLDSWDPKNQAMICGPDGIWRTKHLDATIPAWTCVLDLSATSEEACFVQSSICQQGLWMCTQKYGLARNLYARWSTEGGDAGSWASTLITGNARDVNLGDLAFIECSVHDAQKAWVLWHSAVGVPSRPYVAKTIDQWANFTSYSLGANHTGKWPRACHHRYLDNADDMQALYGIGNVIRKCATDTGCSYESDVNTASGQPINSGCLRVYTWGTGGYWNLNNDRYYEISEDGKVWTAQATLPGVHRFISGWPYIAERFYATQDGTAAPLLISNDRGLNWQAQTGNWPAICATLGVTPQITCCVPVWVE